uniref:Uncharacterized protein LOC114340720 n=1 Tax=Diabrotica virgifera virgifera TaxID=50390 RepID=A0A6P7GD13_DIAVI
MVKQMQLLRHIRIYPHIWFFVSESHSDDDDTPEYEDIVYDSFESDSEGEYYNITEFQQVELRHDVTNTPLPPEPRNSESNGFDKFTKNISKFKKNFSRDITKSLRRFSRKIYQQDIDIDKKDEDIPSPIINDSEPLRKVSKDESIKSEKTDNTKQDSFLSRIRRSVSLSAVSVTNLSNYFENQNNTQNQRRSIFYLNDPSNNANENEIIEEKVIKNESPLETPTKPNRSKMVRPRMPPPPVPPKNNGKYFVFT